MKIWKYETMMSTPKPTDPNPKTPKSSAFISTSIDRLNIHPAPKLTISTPAILGLSHQILLICTFAEDSNCYRSFYAKIVPFPLMRPLPRHQLASSDYLCYFISDSPNPSPPSRLINLPAPTKRHPFSFSSPVPNLTRKFSSAASKLTRTTISHPSAPSHQNAKRQNREQRPLPQENLHGVISISALPLVMAAAKAVMVMILVYLRLVIGTATEDFDSLSRYCMKCIFLMAMFADQDIASVVV